MSESDIQLLIDMGFTTEKAEKALDATGYNGVQQAAEWLLSHSYDSGGGNVLGTASNTETSSSGDNEGATPLVQPLSLKCDDCGKLLRTELEMQTHAARTKHVNFSESTEDIKPLTDEEKKAQVARLQEKIKLKRAEREAQQIEDNIKKEKIRRKTGQELTQIRHELELKEAKKIAEQKKREKMEDALARQKVKEEIARDREDKIRKEKNEKILESYPVGISTVKKEYDMCKLQIRLFDGKTLVNTFHATDTLVEVNRYILMNRTDGDQPYQLMTTFPRHVFTGEEISTKTLKELDLVPSSVIILTKNM